MTRIMIVDDSSTIRQQVSTTLSAAGFEVIEAVDGEDALAQLSRAAGCSLVICDVNMPRLNGLDMLEQLRNIDALKELPVLMLTTEGQPEYVQRARSLGAKGWMVKPVKAELLLAAVQKLTGTSSR